MATVRVSPFFLWFGGTEEGQDCVHALLGIQPSPQSHRIRAVQS